MAELQCLIGLKCSNFVMIAADQTYAPQSVVVMKNDENKLHEIAEKLLMGVIGESGETIQFAQFVSKNIQLYKMRNYYELDTSAAVHFTRKSLADKLRGGDRPIQMNLLIAGYDKEGGHLYALDWLAACVMVPYAVHGFAGMICQGILDKYHKDSLTEEEAYGVLKLCVCEVHKRLFFNLPNFTVKVVCKSGVHELPSITPASF